MSKTQPILKHLPRDVYRKARIVSTIVGISTSEFISRAILDYIDTNHADLRELLAASPLPSDEGEANNG